MLFTGCLPLIPCCLHLHRIHTKKKQVSQGGVDIFRFCYFFAAWPVLFVCVTFVTNKAFSLIEWYYREALFYLDSVRRTARGVVFMCLLLPWFVVCFWEGWCPDSGCKADAGYKKVGAAALLFKKDETIDKTALTMMIQRQNKISTLTNFQVNKNI